MGLTSAINKRKVKRLNKKNLKEQKKIEKKRLKDEKKKEQEEKKRLLKEDKKVYSETKEKLEILSMTEEGYFKTKTGFLDIFQIESMDIKGMNEIEARTVILSFAYMLKVYNEDLKIISMNYPTNTKIQQSYLEKKIKECTNKDYLYFLEKSLKQLRLVEKVRSDREFYCIIFAKDEKEMKDNRENILSNSKSIGVYDIEPEKKINILRKLNNMNSNIS
ncbi:MAG: hypothetical protein ACLR60_08505 [Clostridium paraputrificum]